MTADGLTLQPLIPVVLIAVLAALGVLMCLREAWRASGVAGRLRWLPRALIVLVLSAMCLRPTVPAPPVEVAMSNADLYFVVDTTASMAALDGPAAVSRLDQARTDIVAMVDEIGATGARASLLTFDREARTVVPLTTDTGAVARAAALLRPEVADASTGSSVTVAATLLSRTLANVADAYPDRATVVVYLGDGEQTADDDPVSFGPVAPLVQGGLVLGYGTAAGATIPARQVSDRSAGGELVLDPATGQPALSRADEAALTRLAGQLGLPYAHRDDSPTPTIPAPTVRTVVANAADLPAGLVGAVPAGSSEHTWIGAIVLTVLLLGELFGTVVALGRSGLPRRPR
ncbi:vWA domain-containing protein [Cellulomonas timonensis]|uniref:vWA domain-containing protein n=1 Tax=Cellulomonas timonensis TaxID=1689271 RepID=UPI000835DF41|nr:vWA domain-containing protein [Cellulomonas timonensis]